MEKIPLVFPPTAILYRLVAFVMVVLAPSPSSADLSFNFYAASCPSAEFVVRNTVRSATSVDPTIPGKLLRLVFHDCFVNVSPFIIGRAL